MKRKSTQTGFSIVEIVVAVLIIGVLASILIPVLVTKMEKAKVATAQAEVMELTNAEERVEIDTGHYVRLFVLDDVADGDGYGLGDVNDRVDGIRDEGLNNIYQYPREMFILIKPTEQRPMLKDSGKFWEQIAFATTESSYKWEGPYIDFKRTTARANTDTAQTTTYPRHMFDTPADPWGNDYLFFNRMGVVLEPEGKIVGDAEAASMSFPPTQVFQRATILSLGPNGVPGDGSPTAKLGTGDDIFRSFGY